MFPNPANDIIHIDWQEYQLNKGIIEVYDIQGKLIHQAPVSTNKEELTISTADWTEGFYQLIITDNDNNAYRSKLIVAH